jgi:hypothetical protein
MTARVDPNCQEGRAVASELDSDVSSALISGNVAVNPRGPVRGNLPLERTKALYSPAGKGVDGRDWSPGSRADAINAADA